MNPTVRPIPPPAAPAGLQQLLLFGLARAAALLCTSALTARALARSRRASPGASPTAAQQPLLAGSSAPAPPRASLLRAAALFQLAWLAAEVALAASLLALSPALTGGAAPPCGPPCRRRRRALQARAAAARA